MMKPIDLSVGTLPTGIDEADVKQALDYLMQSLPTYEQELKEAHATHDMSALTASTAKLLGGSAYCGVPILQDALKQLLISLQENLNNEQVEGLYNAVLVAISDLKTAYNAFLEDASPTC